MALFNFESLKDQYDGDEEFVKILIGTYVEETEKHLAEVDSSFADSDHQMLCRAAHSIKSSAANLGVDVVREIAEKLELGSKEEVPAQGEALIVDLKEKNKALLEELSRYL